jgi:hypothetical protein
MAERDEMQKRYAYNEMSNKVQQADRSLLRSVRSEPTGEVESLWARKDVGRMGDRIVMSTGDGEGNKAEGAAVSEKARPADLEHKLERARKKRLKEDSKQRANKSGGTGGEPGGSRRGGGGENILGASGGQTILDLGNLVGYQPTNPMSREAYENMLVRFNLRCTVSTTHKVQR